MPGREGSTAKKVEMPYESEENVTAIYGRNATLACSFNASTGHSVRWIFKLLSEININILQYLGQKILPITLFLFLIKAAWIRYDTRTILTMHEEKVTQSNHYSTDNKQDNSDLIITEVREDDAGIYICQINTEPLRNKVTFYEYCFNLSFKQNGHESK